MPAAPQRRIPQDTLGRIHDLLADTRHRVMIEAGDVVPEVRLDTYPDGGPARLRLFGELA